ncbi:hypothetical protein BO85DRAFT_275618 [Aspergillus piperis CBS 112811]|uniref:Uncharacterized protein n=1 Tax=Aspergillus piperis CBS 112811 TaxID=1448313 RepID=A0A8G1R2P8_9EURO|nr:hypothetical protein BO85DRAFT_275618 [Aspergillus piperis CBS 112811]RAH58468.1 hypothetical protein BO85DRAFT_275618 [Aspergillus piperis CBS 112811]
MALWRASLKQYVAPLSWTPSSPLPYTWLSVACTFLAMPYPWYARAQYNIELIVCFEALCKRNCLLFTSSVVE